VTPDTRFLIEQEIRHYRGILSGLMKWNQRQPHSSTRIENFERIAFWREVLNAAERRIGTIAPHRASAAESQVTG
jgi:hypothetical protein